MKLKHRRVIVAVNKLLFFVYIAFLAYFLFFSERYGRTTDVEEYRYNLVLFKEVRRFITYRDVIGIESFLINILGNIIAFAPFGFVLPIINRDNRKFLNITLLSFEFSLTVELIQLFFKVGIFDVDDILLNTIGGIVGYICFTLFHKIYYRNK